MDKCNFFISWNNDNSGSANKSHKNWRHQWSISKMLTRKWSNRLCLCAQSIYYKPTWFNQIQCWRKIIYQNSKLCSIRHYNSKKWKTWIFRKLPWHIYNWTTWQQIFGENSISSGNQSTWKINFWTTQDKNSQRSKFKCAIRVQRKILISSHQIQWSF